MTSTRPIWLSGTRRPSWLVSVRSASFAGSSRSGPPARAITCTVRMSSRTWVTGAPVEQELQLLGDVVRGQSDEAQPVLVEDEAERPARARPSPG